MGDTPDLSCGVTGSDRVGDEIDGRGSKPTIFCGVLRPEAMLVGELTSRVAEAGAGAGTLILEAPRNASTEFPVGERLLAAIGVITDGGDATSGTADEATALESKETALAADVSATARGDDILSAEERRECRRIREGEASGPFVGVGADIRERGKGLYKAVAFP
jgi:hypothetical protein